MPHSLIGIIPKDTFGKGRLYAIAKTHYSIVHDLFTFGQSMCLLFLNGFAYFWDVGKFCR